MEGISNNTTDQESQVAEVSANKTKDHLTCRRSTGRGSKVKLSTKFLLGFCVANAAALIGVAIVISTAR
mgnify:CR=1 FL=1